jgi:hypothetical protein
VLNAFARMLNPLLPTIRAAGYGGYYWVLDQAEITADVMFKTRPQLREVWPDLLRHASLNMSSVDVVGFLGRKLHPSVKAQVVTDTERRRRRPGRLVPASNQPRAHLRSLQSPQCRRPGLVPSRPRR